MNGVPITHEQKEEFLQSYISGERVVDIASDLGVGKSSLYNILKDVKVIKRLEEERHVVQNQTRNMIARDAQRYINNIKDIANNSTDVRTKLKANETLVAYLIGNPSSNTEVTIKDETDSSSDISSYLNSIKGDIGEDINE